MTTHTLHKFHTPDLGMFLLTPKQIIYAESGSDGATIYTAFGPIQTTTSLSDVEQILQSASPDTPLLRLNKHGGGMVLIPTTSILCVRTNAKLSCREVLMVGQLGARVQDQVGEIEVMAQQVEQSAVVAEV